jgi:hypothetical protein
MLESLLMMASYGLVDEQQRRIGFLKLGFICHAPYLQHRIQTGHGSSKRMMIVTAFALF